VASEVVGSREHRVAGLSRRGVGPHAAVGSRLSIARSDGGRSGNTVGRRRGLPVSLAAVLLELSGSVESLSAAAVRASVSAGISPSVERLLDDGGCRRVVRVPPRRLGRGVTLHVRSSAGCAVCVIAKRVGEAAFPPAGDRHAPADLLEIGILTRGVTTGVGRHTAWPEEIHLGDVTLGGAILEKSIFWRDGLRCAKLLLRPSGADH